MSLAASTERCGACDFWARSGYAEAQGLADSGEVGTSISSCRRHAPMAGEDEARAVWPRTNANEVCGEFEWWAPVLPPCPPCPPPPRVAHGAGDRTGQAYRTRPDVPSVAVAAAERSGEACADGLAQDEQQNPPPKETTGKVEDLDPARISEVVAEGDGFWRTCSGCHEMEEGQDVGHYPFSRVFNCKLGGGCGDCGGLGAIWDTTDYDAMGREIATGKVEGES